MLAIESATTGKAANSVDFYPLGYDAYGNPVNDEGFTEALWRDIQILAGEYDATAGE